MTLSLSLYAEDISFILLSFVAETLILNNMDITELVCESGSAAYGVKNPKVAESTESTVSDTDTENEPQQPAEDTNDINCEKILQSFYKGECDIGSVCTIFESQLPIIPVVYKTGILFYSNKIETEPVGTVSDIFFSLENFSVTE